MKRTGTLLIKLLLMILFLGFSACKEKKTTEPQSSGATAPCQSDWGSSQVIDREEGDFKAIKASSAIYIDGCSTDATWAKLDWYGMNYVWMGDAPDASDYQGKFKLSWDEDFLYILVSVEDEHLHPTLEDGKENYWKGDYVEVFIDEDQSGGNHQFNHQAFAYHVSTEGHAIDKSTTQETVFFDDHVKVQRSQEGNYHLWEMAIRLYDTGFDENSENNTPVKIIGQKRIGFSMAYGDNDGKQIRENFIGSKKTHGVNNDEGYVNSDVFGSITFVD